MAKISIRVATLIKYIEDAKNYIDVNVYPQTEFAEDAISGFKREIIKIKNGENV